MVPQVAKQLNVKVLHLVCSHDIWMYSYTLYLLRLVYPLSRDKLSTRNAVILILYYCNIITILNFTVFY